MPDGAEGLAVAMNARDAAAARARAEELASIGESLRVLFGHSAFFCVLGESDMCSGSWFLCIAHWLNSIGSHLPRDLVCISGLRLLDAAFLGAVNEICT